MAKRVRKNTKYPTKSLLIKNELFCKLYTQNSALFGNGTLCYAEAYDFKLAELNREAVYENGKKIEASEYEKAYNTCSVNANQLLRKPKIQSRVTELLNELMNDKYVDSQLVKVIAQDTDLTPKVAAIREYNKLRQRIVEKQDITSNGKTIEFPPVSEMTSEQIDEYLKSSLTRTATGTKR